MEHAPKEQARGKAVAALVLGILAFVLKLGPLAAVPAWIMGRREIRRIDATGEGLLGRGLAQAGVALAVINMLVCAGIVVYYAGIWIMIGPEVRDLITDL